MSPQRSPTPLRKPTCAALVLCDAAHRDRMTGKVSLLGTFNIVWATRFPHKAPPCVVHFALGDGHGDYRMQVALEEEATGRTVVEMTNKQVRMDSPIHTVESEVPVPAIRYERPGRYWFKLYADGALIAQRAIWATVVPGPKPKG